jgi:hypothetical protein
VPDSEGISKEIGVEKHGAFRQQRAYSSVRIVVPPACVFLHSFSVYSCRRISASKTAGQRHAFGMVHRTPRRPMECQPERKILYLKFRTCGRFRRASGDRRGQVASAWLARQSFLFVSGMRREQSEADWRESLGRFSLPHIACWRRRAYDTFGNKPLALLAVERKVLRTPNKNVLHPCFSRYSSIMRRIKSATLMPSFFACFSSQAYCWSVKWVDRLCLLINTLLAHQENAVNAA